MSDEVGNCSWRVKKLLPSLKASGITQTFPFGKEENYEKYAADNSAISWTS